MADRPPYSSPYDLEHLPARGLERALKPTGSERDRIAAWLGIEAVPNLQAVVRLTRTGSGRFAYHAHFDADVVQACVVTLEPVPSQLAEDFERSFQLAPAASGRHGKKAAPEPPGAISGLDADGPEMLESSVIDLAAPVLEELSLLLDPYPRKAGVSFSQPEEAPAGPADNPFAVLGKLKDS